jgi:hypothetical protein
VANRLTESECPNKVFSNDPVLEFNIFILVSLDPDTKLPFGNVTNA